jgi:hypothetical protein
MAVARCYGLASSPWLWLAIHWHRLGGASPWLSLAKYRHCLASSSWLSLVTHHHCLGGVSPWPSPAARYQVRIAFAKIYQRPAATTTKRQPRLPASQPLQPHHATTLDFHQAQLATIQLAAQLLCSCRPIFGLASDRQRMEG